jgi:beta-lactamase regulating signal transducer with metallopeptidase domain
MTAHVIGWTLVHSIWEGGLIAALLVVIRSTMRGAKSDTRYLMSVAALALMLIAPLITAALLYGTNGSASNEIITRVAPGSFGGLARQRVDLIAPWLVDLWLLGVLAFSVRLVAGLLRTRALIEEGTRPADEWVVTLTYQLMDRIGMRQVVRVLESSRVHVPLVAGWLRPALLIPGSLLTGLTPYQLELIIVHELAHIRRHDYLVNVCQAVAETLLFYHPAIWWISGRIRDEREHCCDDFTLVACGGSARDYATVLLTIEESRGQALGFAAAASGGSLVRRVRRLVSGSSAHAEPRMRALMTSAGVALAAVLFGTLSTTMGPRTVPRVVALDTHAPVSTPTLLLAPNPVGAYPRLDVERRPAPESRSRVATSRAVPVRAEAAIPLDARLGRAVAGVLAEGRENVWISYLVHGTSYGAATVYLDVAAGSEDAPVVLAARDRAPSTEEDDSQPIMTIGSAGNAESVALLEQLVASAPDTAGEQVASLIGHHSGAAALDALAEIARGDTVNMVKAAAVEAIGLLPQSGAVDTLGAMATDLSPWGLRNVAVDALTESPAASHAVNALRLLALGRYGPEVRRGAVAELSRFPATLAVPALSDILENGAGDVQRAALDALGSLAPSSDALAVLKSTKGVWASDARPDIQIRAMRQLQTHAFDVDSTFLTQVATQHNNSTVRGIALAIHGGQ